MTRTLPKKVFKNQELNGFQDMLVDVFNSLSVPQNYSRILKDVSLVIGDNLIPHGLNRALTGWAIVDIDGASDIYKTTSNSRFITLNSSAAVTVSLEVF